MYPQKTKANESIQKNEREITKQRNKKQTQISGADNTSFGMSLFRTQISESQISGADKREGQILKFKF